MAKLERHLPTFGAGKRAENRSAVGLSRLAVVVGAAVTLSVAFGGANTGAEAGAQPQWSPLNACMQLPRNLTANRIDLVATPELSIFRREVMRQDATPVEQLTAQTACARAVQVPAGRVNSRTRFSAPANLCVGDASLRAAATQDRERNYQAAFCSFQTAIDLAAISRAAGNDTAAEALQKQATTALEWRTLTGSQTMQGAELLRAAAHAYEGLTQLQQNNAAAHYALADVYMQLGRDADAEREIQVAANLPNGGGAAALALVRLAERRQQAGAPDAQVLALLNRALPSRSVSVNSAVGIVYERMGNSVAARQAFLNATATDAINDSISAPGSINYLAEAYYWLAEIGSRNASSSGDWQSVLDNANAASRAGGVGLKNNRPICLANIALGGDPLKDGLNSSLCDSVQGADGQLLRGMYNLRRAQYFTNFSVGQVSDRETQWRGFVMQALSSFVAGRTILNQTPQPTDPRQLDERRRLEAQLAYGEAVAQRVNAFCRVARPSGTNDAVALFNNLHVIDCRA